MSCDKPLFGLISAVQNLINTCWGGFAMMLVTSLSNFGGC